MNKKTADCAKEQYLEEKAGSRSGTMVNKHPFRRVYLPIHTSKKQCTQRRRHVHSTPRSLKILLWKIAIFLCTAHGTGTSASKQPRRKQIVSYMGELCRKKKSRTCLKMCNGSKSNNLKATSALQRSETPSLISRMRLLYLQRIKCTYAICHILRLSKTVKLFVRGLGCSCKIGSSMAEGSLC